MVPHGRVDILGRSLADCRVSDLAYLVLTYVFWLRCFHTGVGGSNIYGNDAKLNTASNAVRTEF